MENRKKLVYAVIAVLLISWIAYTGFLKRENESISKQLEQIKQDPQSIAKEEVKQLVEKVAKLVVLPEGEDPVVATVTDKEKLKDQPVFSKSENGDKILIYSNAKKAYVYRPDKNVIIDVIPVNLGDTTVNVAGVSADAPLKVALVNGTGIANKAGELEQRIKDKKIVGIEIVTKSTAKFSGYKRTVVIDLTGKLVEQTKSLASLLDAEVATETSEIKPNADVMVIIGENFK